jgi:ribose transport system substrate-binding protein
VTVRKVFAALVVILLAVAAASCGGGENGDEGAQATGTTTTEASSGEAAFRQPLDCTESPSAEELASYKAPKANERYDITVMEVSLNGYYYQLLAYGALEAAKDAGVDVRITAAQGYTTPAVQLNQAENVIERGTDGVVFAPVDIEASVATVEKFEAQDIPVVNVSTEVASPYVYTIMQDDYLMGKDMADRISELVPDGGRGILMAGPSNATWSRKRAEGFKEQVETEHDNLEIVASPTSLVDPGEALTKFTNALSANPDIDWIASVDYSLPVPQSIPEQYKDLPYVTMGFDPNLEEAVASGLVNSTLPTDAYYMGYVGVGTVVSLLNGDEATKFNCQPFSPAITKDNLDTPFVQSQLYPEGFKATTG